MYEGDIVEHIAQGIGLKAPLTLTELGEGLYLLHDPIVGEEYGKILANENRLQLFHVKEGDHLNRIFFDLDTVSEIKEGHIGEIEVEFLDGSYVVSKKEPIAPVGLRLDGDCSYNQPNQRTLTYFLYKYFPDIEDKVYFDTLSSIPMIDRSLYGGDETVIYQGKKSADVTRIVSRLEEETREVTRRGVTYTERLKVSHEMVDRIIKEIIDRRKRNMFVEELRRVVWDGKPRMDTFFKTIGGYAHLPEKAEEEYLAVAMRMFLTSALERNLSEDYPAIQAMLVLIGGQGSGKSGFCMRFGFGSKKWYRPTPESFKDRKKLIESASGAVILELIESIQFEDDSSSLIKSTVDMTDTQYRKVYAEQTSNTHVYHTMVATTNNEIILKDATGNRRFFPVFMDIGKATKNIWEFTDEEIWQVWAEALHYYNNGERWNTNMYEADGHTIRKFIAQAQHDVAEPEMGGTAIRTYLDSDKDKCKVGAKVREDEIRSYLLLQTDFSATQQEEILSNFRHHAMGYGWEKVTHPLTYHDGPKIKSTRQAWKRVQPPIYEEVAEGEC